MGAGSETQGAACKFGVSCKDTKSASCAEDKKLLPCQACDDNRHSQCHTAGASRQHAVWLQDILGTLDALGQMELSQDVRDVLDVSLKE